MTSNSPNPFSGCTLSDDQLRVSQILRSKRQCTSDELIRSAKISNPNLLIAELNQLLIQSASPWRVLSTISRGNARQAPLAYYRLLRTAV